LPPIRQVALNELCPGIESAPMALDQVVENCNFVAFIHQKLGAHASDIARPPSDEDSHGRGKCSGTGVKSKRTARGRRLGDGFALLFLKGCNHPLYAMMFATRREDFQA